MQRNEASRSVVRPANAQLRAFADRLSSLHPADIRHILWAIAEFGYQFYPVIDPGAPPEFVDQLHQATDSAHTLGVVFRQVSEIGFQEFMGDVAVVFDLAISYFASSYNGENHDAYLVLIQLRHLRSSLVCPAAVIPTQHSDHAASSHLAVVAGICVAALIWVLVSDHIPLWQLLAALLLVGAFGGLAFRLGKKAATGLETSVT